MGGIYQYLLLNHQLKNVKPPRLRVRRRCGAIDDAQEYFISKRTATTILYTYIYKQRLWSIAAPSNVSARRGFFKIRKYKYKLQYIIKMVNCKTWKRNAVNIITVTAVAVVRNAFSLRAHNYFFIVNGWNYLYVYIKQPALTTRQEQKTPDYLVIMYYLNGNGYFAPTPPRPSIAVHALLQLFVDFPRRHMIYATPISERFSRWLIRDPPGIRPYL